jgi:acetyl-CoA carboxylase biotin carboxyl carrier protein
MDTRKIKKLIELVKETGIGELEVKSGEESVRISTTTSQVAAPTYQAPAQQINAAPAEARAPAKEESTTEKATEEEHHKGHILKSPMVGTVYLASTPGAKPLVSVGQHVEVGDTLCLIEAMKMFNKIEADKAGVISARLIENETPVEYDQPLFIIDTDD